MGDCYYIGKRRTGRRKERRGAWLLIPLSLFLAVALLCGLQLYPYLEAAVRGESEKRITALVSDAVSEVLAEGSHEYGDLVRLSYGADGYVSSLSVNTPLLNTLRYRIALCVLSRLSDRALTVRVPLARLFGAPSSADGSGISVVLETEDSLRADFSSRFSECGINQTLHVISFDMTITVYFMLPFSYRALTLSASVLAAETVIVGRVPDSFTDIDRLTDDVGEIDIDDAVDFGPAGG